MNFDEPFDSRLFGQREDDGVGKAQKGSAEIVRRPIL